MNLSKIEDSIQKTLDVIVILFNKLIPIFMVLIIVIPASAGITLYSMIKCKGSEQGICKPITELSKRCLQSDIKNIKSFFSSLEVNAIGQNYPSYDPSTNYRPSDEAYSEIPVNKLDVRSGWMPLTATDKPPYVGVYNCGWSNEAWIEHKRLEA